MNKIIFFVLLSFSLLAFAGKESAQLESESAQCGELSNYGLLAECTSKLNINANIVLNKEYKSLADYLQKKDRNRLKLAQLNWMKFRDTDCQFVKPSNDISHLGTAEKNICLYQKTIARIKELEIYNEDRGCNGCEW